MEIGMNKRKKTLIIILTESIVLINWIWLGYRCAFKTPEPVTRQRNSSRWKKMRNESQKSC